MAIIKSLRWAFANVGARRMLKAAATGAIKGMSDEIDRWSDEQVWAEMVRRWEQIQKVACVVKNEAANAGLYGGDN